jgi:hypothetical protein
VDRRFEALELDLGDVKADLGDVKADLGEMKGASFEIRVRDHPGRYIPRKLAAGARLIDQGRLESLLLELGDVDHPAGDIPARRWYSWWPIIGGGEVRRS